VLLETSDGEATNSILNFPLASVSVVVVVMILVFIFAVTVGARVKDYSFDSIQTLAFDIVLPEKALALPLVLLIYLLKRFLLFAQ
jgi:hypothetical protein